MLTHSLLLLFVVAQLAHLALGHGRLISPAPFFNDDVGSFPNFPCGGIDVQQALSRSPPITVTAGGEAQVQWQITNGDGAGPVAVQIDPTGTAKSFQTLQITQQIPGVRGDLPNARNQRVTLGFRIPVGLQCQAPGGKCLLKVTQANAPRFTFGSCGAVVLAGAQQRQTGGRNGTGARAQQGQTGGRNGTGARAQKRQTGNRVVAGAGSNGQGRRLPRPQRRQRQQ